MNKEEKTTSERGNRTQKNRKTMSDTILLSGFLRSNTSKIGDFTLKQLVEYISSNPALKKQSQSIKDVSYEKALEVMKELPKTLTSGVVNNQVIEDDFRNQSYTGCFHFNLYIKDPDEKKRLCQAFKNDPHTTLMYSLRKDIVSIIIKTDNSDINRHSELYNSTIQLFEDSIDAELIKDSSLLNMMYLAHDTEVYYNENAEDFIIEDDLSQLKSEFVEKVAEKRQRNSGKFSLKKFSKLIDIGSELEDPKRLWGEYIPEESIIFFPSERGTGKTFLAIEIGLAIANNQTSFLNEKIELNGSVVLFNFELGERLIAQRADGLFKHAKFPIKDNKFEILTVSGATLKETFNEYLDYLRELKPVLIIIDNLRTAFAGADNENNRVMTEAMTHLKAIRDEIGCAILIVHHLRKGSTYKMLNSDSQSGAGALTDLVDGDFMMRRVPNSSNRYLKRLKSRIFPESDNGKILSMGDGGWMEVVKDNVPESDILEKDKSKDEKYEQATQLLNSGKSQTEIAQLLNVDKGTITKWKKSGKLRCLNNATNSTEKDQND